MRWDRLFSDLEAQADELEREERDELVAELAAGEWAGTRWHELLGGHVVLDVLGVGHLAGEAVLATPHVVHLVDGPLDVVVSTAFVVAVVAAERRSAGGGVRDRLGWSHVLRALRADADGIRLRRADGVVASGVVEAVGQDFVRMRDEDGRVLTVPFTAVVTVSSRR